MVSSFLIVWRNGVAEGAGVIGIVAPAVGGKSVGPGVNVQ